LNTVKLLKHVSELVSRCEFWAWRLYS